MKRTFFVAALASTLAASGGVARASLTTSESEQVRGYVAGETHADRVRAFVARPDLTADESATVMTAALGGASLDDRRIAFLQEVVSGGPTPASRPVLAVATVRGLLARADALYAQHPADLDRSPALAEIARAYVFAAGEVADPASSDSERADLARALSDHVGRNGALLKLDVPVSPAVARVRAQVALALYDAMPDGPTRRVDAADKLGLTGARRSAIVELGLLLLDAGGTDVRMAELRALLDRFPGARDGAEAVVVGDEHATFRARGGVVVTGDSAPGPLGEPDSPWGADAAPPAIEASTMAIARGLAAAAVHRAVERRPALRVQVEHDGGEAGVATFAAMLALDGPRTVEVAAARSLAGKRENLAWLGDALGALAVFAPAGAAADGLSVPLGHVRATHVALEPTGAASAFRLDPHLWRIERDGAGIITAVHRDGAPVAMSMLPDAHVAATEAKSWTGAGLVFARLAGVPHAVIGAGPRVRVTGTSGVADAIVAPAPGDDVAVETDLRVDGGPAGIVVRALPTATGFKGVSLVLIPGTKTRAVLLFADGAGTDTAAAPVVDLAGGATQHVRLVVRGNRVEAKLGGATLTATLPDDLAHGDVALRAYPGATVEAGAWRVRRAP
jgi:hypothetical protein